MHPRYVVIHKQRGETPLGAIEDWKDTHPEYASLPASYAGRLDPMAEGKLLVLLGEECKRQAHYMGLDKEYEIEVLLDLKTDTSDVLGLPIYGSVATRPSRETVRKALQNVSGTHRVPYPAFSSKTVDGTPLFLYALRGTLGSIKVPEHDETVYRIKTLSVTKVKKRDLEDRITSALSNVPRSDEASKELGADFRQDEIRTKWHSIFEAMPERAFTVLRLHVACASGTYMRALAMRIGKELGTTALALSITRTRIGTYKKLGPFGFWLRSY